ncbi:MAG: AAA family ATPase [Rhodobacterales bacterium]|nr:AAA family ATPase [Rhodobacterales bacterium]
MDHYNTEADRQALSIAVEWGISSELLDQVGWELEEISGNEGENYSFLVRFDEGADPHILEQLGLSKDHFTREVSLNAFDETDTDTTIEEISGTHVVDTRSTRAKRWIPLTEISVRNFKAAREAEIPLGNVTILVGPNGSGKSSVLQAVHWAARAASYALPKNQKEMISFKRLDYIPSSEEEPAQARRAHPR